MEEKWRKELKYTVTEGEKHRNRKKAVLLYAEG